MITFWRVNTDKILMINTYNMPSLHRRKVSMYVNVKSTVSFLFHYVGMASKLIHNIQHAWFIHCSVVDSLKSSIVRLYIKMKVINIKIVLEYKALFYTWRIEKLGVNLGCWCCVRTQANSLLTARSFELAN